MTEEQKKEQTDDWRNSPCGWFWLLTEWQKDQNPEKTNEALQNLKRLGYKIDITPTPTAEREVLVYNTEGQPRHIRRIDEECILCPMQLGASDWDEASHVCMPSCAWFRIHNGLAMCGNKIIGKIIEPPKEEE